MRVFVTGSQGRIGRYVQAQLEEAGHTVVGFDQVSGDEIRDPAAVRAGAQGCDAIIHMAAMLADPKDDPNAVMHVNLQGTWHVLTAAETLNIRRVVTFSSVNAMGIFIGESLPDYLPIDEDHPCRPGRPYALSKYLGEEMCRLFTRRTG
ncbi:MAG TPA: NAD(P)-dependent oxidoreductase, partial [Caldilineaceae bacterium]|nr:NAD(P)-dependent oxidoreductase [Caldilineaceae bacterium]